MRTPTDQLRITRSNFPSTLLSVGALGCLCVAAWLGFVVALVLPARDPGMVPLWTTVAVGFALYGAAGLWLGARPGVRGLRWGQGVASPLIIALGAISLRIVWGGAGGGGNSEGYLVVMAGWLTAQGCAVLLFLYSTRRRDELSARATG